jgi:hypothetical protein
MRSENPTPDQVAIFLNKHHQDMTCDKNGKQVHYMRYAFERGLAFYSLFKKYLSDKIWMNMKDESLTINVNAVSYMGPNDEPETVLDYMLREVKRPGISAERKGKINETINVLVDRFDAKTYAKLLKEEEETLLARR